MARDTIRTHDAELYIGFPTQPTDDPSVQVGVRYGDHCAWAVLNRHVMQDGNPDRELGPLGGTWHWPERVD